MAANQKFSDFERYTIGFHGTSSAAAEEILRTQNFVKSVESSDFLGEGVYFYENSREWASRWARNKYKDNYSVLKAYIVFGRCIDLCDCETISMIRKAAAVLATKIRKPVSIGSVINYISKENKVDTIRAAQQQDKNNKILKHGQLYDGFRIMICVKSIDNIKDLKIA